MILLKKYVMKDILLLKYCSFCLDTKRTKKVKADEKRLKLFERISCKK